MDFENDCVFITHVDNSDDEFANELSYLNSVALDSESELTHDECVKALGVIEEPQSMDSVDADDNRVSKTQIISTAVSSWDDSVLGCLPQKLFFSKEELGSREVYSARIDWINELLLQRIIQDDVFAIPKYPRSGGDRNKYDWPAWAVLDLYNPHKDRGKRFALFAFLWKNGCPPDTANVYIMWHHQYGIIYDRSAWRDQAGMLAAVKSRGAKNPGTYNALLKKETFNLDTGRVDL